MFKTLEVMNLENLNVVELNANEVKEVEGGFGPLLYNLAVFALGVYVGYNEAKQ